jgi:transmembrane sensor
MSDRFNPMTTDEATAYWHARHQADPACARDPAFLAWLAASTEHARAWSKAEAIWAQVEDDLESDGLIQALRTQALAARPPIWPKALVAAGLVGLVAAGALTWRLTSLGQTGSASIPVLAQSQPPAVGQALRTAVGERQSHTLEDGTQVELDGDSAVEVAFDGKARRLRLLRGQAYFQVAPDPARAFSVEAGGQTIVDRGTEFAARLESGQVTVTLVSGRVSVGPTGAPPTFDLKPGQALQVRGRTGVIKVIDPDQALAWRQGYVEFSGTPLADAVVELNRHGGRRLVIGDATAGRLKISGRFRLGDNERFGRAASGLLPIRVVRRGEDLVIHATVGGSKAP